MAKPIIMGVRGESAEILRSANASMDMSPGDPASLVECVTRLCDDRQHYAALCKNGREFVLSGYNRDVFAKEMLETLQSTVIAETS